MGEPAYNLKPRFTWTDSRSWPADERWELIEGEPFAMSAAPTVRHQEIVLKLAVALEKLFRAGPCRLLLSPMDVRFSEDDVVEPDLLVVCDPAQVRATHIEGAPTLVIEVLSPSTELRDRHLKLALYARYGVQEYWIVDPVKGFVEVLRLREGAYVVDGMYGAEHTLKSPAFDGLAVALEEVFGKVTESGSLLRIGEPGSPPYGRRAAAATEKAS